jgi:hypothetical protein
VSLSGTQCHSVSLSVTQWHTVALHLAIESLGALVQHGGRRIGKHLARRYERGGARYGAFEGSEARGGGIVEGMSV